MFKFGVALLTLCLVSFLDAKPTLSKKKLCRANNGIVSPCYQVIRKTPKYEERKYDSAWWVSTTEQVAAGVNITSKVSRKCYWRLRGYLKAHNASMGVPVIYTIKAVSEGKLNFTMSFYLPKLSITGPNAGSQPHNPLIQLEELVMSVYVKAFKGLPFNQRFSRSHAQQLSKDLKTDGLSGTYITPDVMYISAGYDGPWIRREDRTNEFWLVKS